ncbi:TonB-dependent receptor [bacterium SCSIO 12696]|nr:TonB-dependent receptor [bacterium SCSIO 12696]
MSSSFDVHKNTPVAAFGIVLVSAVCCSTQGVQAAQETVEKAAEEVVSVARRIDDSRLESPHSISTLTNIPFVSQSHIQQALLRVPGVNLHRGNGQEYLPAIRSPVLTGAGACGSFSITEDGIPLRAAGFCNVNELFESHTEQAFRVEVQRGPGTAVHGSNALHGVVNVITQDFGGEPGGRFSVEAGANHFGRIQWRQSGEDWGAKLTLSHDSGYRDQAGYEQQKLSLHRRTELGDWQATAGLSLTNLSQETAGFITGEGAYLSEALSRTNPTPEAFRDASSARLWLRFEQELESGSTVVTPYLRYTRMDFLQHFLPGDPLEENGQASIGVQSVRYWNRDSDLVLGVGADLEFTDAWLRQSQDAPTQGSAFLQETIPVGRHYDYQVNAQMAAVFGSVDWNLTAKVALQAGLRLESMRYDYDNFLPAGRTREDGSVCGFGGCRYSRPEDRSDTFTNLSPKLGASYQLAEGQLVFANWTHGFRAPQAAELYRLQRAQQVAELDSEEANSLELGVRGDFPRLRYELALYRLRKDNVIFRDSDFFNRDNSRTSHHGIEAEISAQLGAGFDVSANASVARHRYDSDQILSGININGNDVDTAPRRFGSLRLGWGDAENMRLEAEWVVAGSYFLDPENLRTYPGHRLLNIRASWQLSSDWTVRARLLNATDRRYAERADFTSFSGFRYFPGEPRSLFVGVERVW